MVAANDGQQQPGVPTTELRKPGLSLLQAERWEDRTQSLGQGASAASALCTPGHGGLATSTGFAERLCSLDQAQAGSGSSGGVIPVHTCRYYSAVCVWARGVPYFALLGGTGRALEGLRSPRL